MLTPRWSAGVVVNRNALILTLAALFAALPGAAAPKACKPNIETCPPEGCGAHRDPDLNRQKNRTATPSGYEPMTLGGFVALNAQAVNKKGRDRWTPSERSRVEGIESRGVMVVAFLYDATLSDAETCNCYREEQSGRDFHIWLAKDAAGAKAKKFLVVEMTPKTRSTHLGWTLAAMKALKPKHGNWTKVRVSGFPLFDSEHWNFPKRKIRATAWEIHPVMTFEYCSSASTCVDDSNEGWTRL
jgi:hypothetical protein